MIKFILGFIVAIILSSVVFGAFMYGKSQSQPTSSTNSIIIPTVSYMPDAQVTSSSENSTTGTVTGKLCYPSEMIPPGKIEAKRVGDNVMFTQEYAGSQSGGTTYSFPLVPGTYNLRFGPTIDGQVSSYGYRTTVCLTGSETTCGDTNPRQMGPATVVSGQTVIGFDLCDFYYQPQNAPVF